MIKLKGNQYEVEYFTGLTFVLKNVTNGNKELYRWNDEWFIEIAIQYPGSGFGPDQNIPYDPVAFAKWYSGQSNHGYRTN